MKTAQCIGMLLLLTVGCSALVNDTCTYHLSVPPDLDLPNTPHFDTTIVRSPGCSKHMLWFPAGGTETRYILQMDTVRRDLHFSKAEVDKQFLDITNLPSGAYEVHLLACSNGGSFTLRIQ
jgi:hypothetical protein